ncbi:hypothetical protein IQ238_27045 [Pleurocapsales cyanobacterium LEGE 06147]|nr:hypothetical protein [Pleurocapsales cyanobacterium LEGE 06147]
MRKALLADDREVNFLVNNATNILLENSIVHGVNGNDSVQFVPNKSRTFSDKLGEILGENDGQKIPIVLGKTQFRNNLIVAGNREQALIVPKTGEPKIYRNFLERDYSGLNNIYWSPQNNVFGIGFQKTSMTDLKGWTDVTGEVNYRWIDPQFVDPNNYDFRLKKNSPLKSRESSLPTRNLNDSKVRELKNYLVWINTLVDRESGVD